MVAQNKFKSKFCNWALQSPDSADQLNISPNFENTDIEEPIITVEERTNVDFDFVESPEYQLFMEFELSVNQKREQFLNRYFQQQFSMDFYTYFVNNFCEYFHADYVACFEKHYDRYYDKYFSAQSQSYEMYMQTYFQTYSKFYFQAHDDTYQEMQDQLNMDSEEMKNIFQMEKQVQLVAKPKKRRVKNYLKKGKKEKYPISNCKKRLIVRCVKQPRK